MKRHWRADEVAELLGVSRASIYREMDRGSLAYLAVGRRRVITRYDLEQYVGSERLAWLLGEDGRGADAR